jgi:hypothetical protein
MPYHQLKPGLLITEQDDQLFVLDKDTGRVHEFNMTAKVIFQLFLERREDEEAVEAFARTFDIPTDQARDDVSDMLQRFQDNDLLLPERQTE